MATIGSLKIQAVMTLHGGPPPILQVLEGASQTFVEGELVVFNGSGYVIEIASDTPAAIYAVSAANAHNDTNAGTHLIPVKLVSPEVLFAGNVLQSGLANHTLVQSDLGTPMAIQRDTSANITYLNASTKAGANVRVFTHIRARGTEINDTNGRVLFNFLPNWIQFLGTS